MSTGGDRIPDEKPLSTGVFPISTPIPGGRRVLIVPGGLATTDDITAIPPDRSQMIVNCNVDHGVWKLDMRYRQWQPSPNGSNTVRGFGFGSSYDLGDFYTVIQGQTVYDVKGGYALSSDSLWAGSFNGTVSKWEPAITPNIEEEDWYVWEHKGYMFYAGRTTGRVRYKPIGKGPLEKLFRRYDLDSVSVLSVERPPYPLKEWDAGNETLTQPPPTAGSWHLWQPTHPWTGIFNGEIWLTPEDESTVHVGQVKVKINFGAVKLDLSGIQHIGFIVDHGSYQPRWWNDLDFSHPDYTYVTITNASPAATNTLRPQTKIVFRKRIRIEGGGACKAWVMIDISGVPDNQKSNIESLEIGWQANWHDVEPPVKISPLYLGGTWWHDIVDTGGIIGKSTTSFPLEYAYAYNGVSGGGSGTPISNAIKAELSAATIMGAELTDPMNGTSWWGQPFSTRMYMGTRAKISVSPASAPYTSADKIDIYRKIPFSRAGFRWQRVAQIPNTGSPSYVDYIPDSVVYSDMTTYPVVNPNFDIFSSNISGEVSGVVCGCSWRGANVYFGTNGKAYFSQQGDFRKVFWDGVTFTVSFDDPSRPRTLTVSDQADDVVITAIPNDALYMFTRRAVYAMTGSVPSNAENPRKMPGLQGVLGHKGACQYQSGALYASESGLYYIEVGSIYTGKPGEARVESLTREVDGTWAQLIGSPSERSDVVVATYDNEIYVFCKNRYMRFTKRGHWVYGEFQSGHNVYNAFGDPKRGMVAMLTNGRMINVGWYSTDLGTNDAGSNGTAPSWSYKTKRYIDDISLQRAIVSYRASTGSPVVSVKGYTSRNTSPGTLSFSGAIKRLPFENHVGKETNGTWFEIELSGSNVTILESLMIDVGSYQVGNNT